jgi:hypothetical protein
MMITLEPQVELQLGLKEKQWQLSHAQVLLHNVDNQAVLLDRLLEEAASLFNRIGDPSVDEDAQKRMKAEYDAVKARAQVRLKGQLCTYPSAIYPASYPATHLSISNLFIYPFTLHLPTHLPSNYPTTSHPSTHPSSHHPSIYLSTHPLSIHPHIDHPSTYPPSIHLSIY